MGMPQIAALIEKAMSALGPTYPRDRDERDDAIEAAWDACDGNESGPFGQLDELFFALIETENGGFVAAADAYAASNG
jgi:predicted HAD superfamily phosphohydrolase